MIRTLRTHQPADPVPGSTVLTVSGINVSYDERRRVLDGIDLTVRAGEVLALVGPNGAGKSTLLGVITGDVETASGDVTICSQPAHAWNARELAMRRAVLLQQVDVAFPFSVLEVVEMGRAPWQRTSAARDDKRIVTAVLDRTETTPFAARTFTSLSGGERSRVALARVLAQAAPILLLDEPTAAMDIRHQELVLATARQYAATGSAVVVVLHSLDLAGAYADRIALLHHGRITADGTPGEVLTSERISVAYDHPVTVFTDPVSGSPLVVPVRPSRKDLP
ncbi:heme ABC transporter ATP-binding protein [Brevibacterium gallinarum]|uniref:Heme ABC transporter ATP-binding protein n=1 Tax=Brevibacterium gallinarum TaxID=2762220 RepID=A0ABR8WXX5_9MICO|nr:heme ABC transporter ATP-binding protein [Brevibacterium gallinarum]MBD8021946.1 heme ABC transporter ATP-binding protein [Brevibacterium gallinarum]